MKKALLLLLSLVLCLALCACGQDSGASSAPATAPSNTESGSTIHTHQWSDATCEAPKTCSICGETEGTKLEHKWERDTCSVPYTCTVCKTTNGEGENHKVVDDKCSVCGKAVAELEKEPAYQYQQALTLLNSNNITSEQIAEAYKLLSGLGNYKDAATYLSRITKLSDVRLYWYSKAYNIFGELVGTIKMHYGYDSAGRIIQQPDDDHYSPDKLIHYSIYITYDKQGRVIQQEKGRMPSEPEQTMIYTYNEAGQIIETKLIQYGSTYSITKHFYNDLGQEIRSELLQIDGTEIVTTYRYNSVGNCIRMEQVTDGEFHMVTEYTYDAAKRKIRSERKIDSAVWNYIYKNGQLIQIDYKNRYSGDNISTTHYVYGDYYVYTPAA